MECILVNKIELRLFQQMCNTQATNVFCLKKSTSSFYIHNIGIYTVDLYIQYTALQWIYTVYIYHTEIYLCIYICIYINLYIDIYILPSHLQSQATSRRFLTESMFSWFFLRFSVQVNIVFDIHHREKTLRPL